MYEKKRYICIDKVNSCGNSRVYESKCDYDKRLRYYLWTENRQVSSRTEIIGN